MSIYVHKAINMEIIMAYKRITIMDISEIIRRRRDGQKIAQISRALDIDRKTVRKYISKFDAKLLDASRKEDSPALPNKLITELKGRPAKKQALLEPYLDEIKSLVNNKANPLKPKTAYEVICMRHDLSGEVSYTTFKRFVRAHRIAISPDRSTCRIEVEPASQIQVDYCKAGLMYDQLAGKRRTVYAFLGTLSFSRHKYVEFVFRQDQKSFVNSHVKMFSWFNGVPKTIAIDNLKAGVIKPDLYDPKLNRSYDEMAQHYGCFIDPCRVARPKDKGKVERDVQTIREQFRKFLAINPSLTLADANIAIKDWLLNDYGRKKHGTTNQEPYLLFTETEKPLLLPLPEEPYEAALWKEATVHPDHYIQIYKKAYSIPHPYVGKKVWVKVTHNLVQVYYNEQLIKQHAVARGYRQTDLHDFPDNIRHALDSGMPLYLCNEAARTGPNLEQLVRKTLSIHAFINLRKAQGIVSIAKKYPAEIIEQAAETALIRFGSISPKLFKSIVEKLAQQHNEQNNQLSLSDETSSFVRDMEYFTHTK